ncbi:sorting nexin-29 isoform X2 [Anthonomus grandis grandis]|uniref:sorting nexin-29 isoform X2 n=1 Tax=Anthonomus grandis grandis TaxID=2921223 RepID=UPI0021667254|nr:sorting nexin-29 isoform X2 [Anthonomus grandis grandis]
MSTGILLLASQCKPEDPDKISKQLLEYVQRCQRRFGGKNELATEFDSCIAGLCLCLEAVFLHGIKSKQQSNQNSVNSTFKQVSDIVAQSLHIKQENISFWSFIERHLTNHERERFNILKSVWTDIGKCKAWLRSTLNEKSLERYLHKVLSDKDILVEHYESWALLRDEERNSMLPNMAAAPRPMLMGSQEEPIIEVPIPENKDRRENKKRKVARQIISFDDDDSMLSTSVPSISSSTCSENSGLDNQNKTNTNMETVSSQNQEFFDSSHSSSESVEKEKSSKPVENKDSERPRVVRKLSIENSGSRNKFQSNVPETLTPINQNNIGELTPVSVERIRDLNESPDNSDDILEVPADISAVLTIVENKNQEEIKRRDARIKLLSKENDSLKEQVKKYMSAIQMLRRDDEGIKNALEGLQLEKQPDYKGEAKVYEQKLVQVAEMHAELMDFNVMLQKTLAQKDSVLERLKNELQELRGPMASDDLNSEESGGSVNIWIPSAFLTGSGSNSHHVYQIFLRVGNDEWNIYRRYAQFYALHSDLKKLDAVVNNFGFPPKKSLGNKDSALVEERRKRLQVYLRKVISHWPELAHCSSRFLLEQHLAFFKDQKEDPKRSMFTSNSRRSGNSGNHSELFYVHDYIFE